MAGDDDATQVIWENLREWGLFTIQSKKIELLAIYPCELPAGPKYLLVQDIVRAKRENSIDYE